MSKSKGEFLTVSLLEERGFTPLVYRLFCLGSHYRKNLVFTWENLENARTAYQKLVAKVAALRPDMTAPIDEAAFAAGKSKFTEALDNDLNTSLAVTALYDVFKLATDDRTKIALIENFDTVLGLGLIEAAKTQKAEAAADEHADLDPAFRAWIEAQIEARRAAKAAKNYAEADAIRAALTERGVTVIDKKEGTVYTVTP